MISDSEEEKRRKMSDQKIRSAQKSEQKPSPTHVPVSNKKEIIDPEVIE